MAIEAKRFASQYISNKEYVKVQLNGQQIRFSSDGCPVIIGDPNLPIIDPTGSFNKSERFKLINNLKRPRNSAFDSDAINVFKKRRAIEQLVAQQTETQQTETLRNELEARQRAHTRILLAALQNAFLIRLKAKDEENIRMVKLNWVLEEQLKNLYVEIQIWRDLAQTNEATANTLRSNLEQVVAQFDELNHAFHRLLTEEDDAESSCGGEHLTVVNGGCRRCDDLTASVLVLPCRHLCLCTVCGSLASLQTCPVCNMTMKASVHVNMS